MESRFDLLENKYLTLLKSDFILFNEVAAMRDIMGVYLIYSPELKIIYIGSTKKFHVRFGTDLKHESTHTLVRKLLKRNIFLDRKLAVEYLIVQCKFKIEKCESKREAEALEHFAIWSLDPEYNK
jgi:hypothetical protein